MLQAKSINERMGKEYPKLAPKFEMKTNELLGELQGIVNQIDQLKNEEKKFSVVTMSPELKYLTRAMGLTDSHLLWFDKLYEQDAKSALQQAEKLIVDSQAIAVLTGSEPNEELQSLCQKLNVELIRIEMFGKEPADVNFLTGTRQNIDRLLRLRSRATE